MLSKTKILLVGHILMLLSAFLQAETSVSNDRFSADIHSINLRDAINKTFEHNPALKSFNYQLKAQQGLQLQASMAASPELVLTLEDVLGTGNYKGVKRAQATLNISWVVEGNIRQAYRDEARANTLSFASEANIKRLDAAAETARLYLVCLANQARLINADKTYQLANETVAAVNKRVRAGKSPEAELARSKAEQARKRLGREELGHRLRSTIRLLAAQWGETNPEFTRVAGDIFSLPAPPSFETLKSRILQNPGILRLLSDKRLKQAQLKLMESQSKREWRVNLGLRQIEFSNDQTLVAGIRIPFGERARNTGNIASAREKLSQNQALQDGLRVRVETTLFVLSQDLQHSLHRINAYRNQIVPLLEAALKQTRRAYDLGRYSYLELRSVQAELLNARTALIEDSVDAHLTVIEIERLTGVSMIKVTDTK